MSAPAVTGPLAAFVAETGSRVIPDTVRTEATRALVNMIAAALGGSGDPAITALLRAVRGVAGTGEAQIIGHALRLDPASAAFVNAAMINVLDFDDAHPGTVIHPAATAGAAMLAIAARRPVAGREALEAFALGMEVACRLGNAISPSHYARGFHISATCGVIGAAATAGRLLRLDARRMAHALGIAATGAGGLVENLGFAAKSVGMGDAARAGVMAALFAEAGADAAPLALEGERGFLKVLCADPRPAQALDGLGARWEVLRNTYKPYPCGVVLNPVIDAALEIAAVPGFSPERLGAITVTGPALLLQRTDRPGASGAGELRLSLQHAVAVTLLRGPPALAAFTPEAAGDPAVAALRGKVAARSDAAMPPGAGAVSCEDETGRRFEAMVTEARGSAMRPLSDAELSGKLAALSACCQGAIDADALLAALWSLDAMPDIRAAIALAAPAMP